MSVTDTMFIKVIGTLSWNIPFLVEHLNYCLMSFMSFNKTFSAWYNVLELPTIYIYTFLQ